MLPSSLRLLLVLLIIPRNHNHLYYELLVCVAMAANDGLVPVIIPFLVIVLEVVMLLLASQQG